MCAALLGQSRRCSAGARQRARLFKAELPAELQAVGGGGNAQSGHRHEIRKAKFEIRRFSSFEFRVPNQALCSVSLNARARKLSVQRILYMSSHTPSLRIA